MAHGEPRIVLHGPMTHSQILDIEMRSWVGLSSFALHRINMTSACPLKVRKYLMAGIPVYGGNDIFPEGAEFYKKGAIDIKEILRFAQQTRYLSREKIISSSKKYICKKSLLSQLYVSLSGKDA